MFSVAAVVTFVGSTFLNGLALAATPDTELGKAYEWAHSKGITTMDTYEAANMDKPITRAQMAKMLSVYAMSELGMKPDTTKTECNEFNDIANITGDLHEYIITSCQLGLMGQQIFSGIKEFRPNANISRAEFGTALSRTLWGGKYEGGTPYYANHLQALQSAGIMKIIANAETTQEIRGYVMLMLMRSAEGSETKADCEDPMIKAACLIDDDSCPAECKSDSKDEKEDTVVKSGDLAVTAKAASDRKILKTGISDLDTITFKTSEDVTINKITLERYGYSDSDASKIKGIWLEDEDGNVIADSKTLSKDKVTLNIKKDYRKVDGTYVATIVVETADAEGTIGFKVTDVDSTAKNLNVDNYSPYTYEVVAYASSTVTVEVKGSDKNYNYNEGESYEIARFKVKAGNKDILIKGMTLTNAGSLDMGEFLDELTVTVDSKEIKAKGNVNKDDKLVVTFNDDVELAMNKSTIIVLSASLKDFDDYGDTVKYGIADSADFNAVEVKNGTRVSLTNNATTWKLHAFAGGKIKISSTRLGNVDAAQASEGTVIAEGNITITEPISKMSFDITAAGAAVYVEKMTMVIDGNDEYDASSIKVADDAKWAKYSYISQFWEDADTTYEWTAEVISSNDSETVLKIITNARTDGAADDNATAFVGKKVVVKQWLEKEADKISKVYMWEDFAPLDKWDQIKDEDDNPLILTNVKLEESAKGTTTFHFENVSIDKSAKVQFKVDIKDDATAAGDFTPASFGATAFAKNPKDNDYTA